SPYSKDVPNNFLQSRYPTKGLVENCSNVALQNFTEETLPKRIEKISTMKEQNKSIIGTTAALNVRYKGQQYVIKALGQLKKQGIYCYEYQLVGNGDKSYLQKMARKYNVEDQVKFIGPLHHNQVFDWLDKIDIYCQPS